jgi:MinD-like ATPase involved in chromosome partitioning or flagellar assembly
MAVPETAGGPGPGGAVHQAALERAFGRILAVITVLFVVEFWFTAGALSGQRPGSVAAGPEAPGDHGTAGPDGSGPAAGPVLSPGAPARSAAWRLGPRAGPPGRRDQQRAAWRRAIGVPVTTPKNIAVFSPRGGVGKTTTALHLGHALAMVRGDPVVALDANPDFGNLVKRVSEPHSAHGAGDLLGAAGRVTRSADLLPYLTQAQSGLWVARSDHDPASRLGPDDYRHLLRLLTRHSPLVVVDLGTGVREPAFLAIAETADVLVAVAEPDGQAARATALAIDWVARRIPGPGRAAAMVLNSARPAVAGASELADVPGGGVHDVVRVPHDGHLAAGGVSRWALLATPTQDAYLRLAASVMTLLNPGLSPGGHRRTAA